MCRSPSGICSCPDRTGLKQRLIRGLWLTPAQVGGRGGRDTVVKIETRGKPAVAEARVMLQQPEVCRVFSRVLPGKLSLDHGTLAVVGCTGFLEGRCG